MKALEKDRARRYDTANAFARDIQRYLAGDPVEAGPPSVTYRLRKLARKHRPWLYTSAAFAALLLGAMAIYSLQARRVRGAERLLVLSERIRAIKGENAAPEQNDLNLKGEPAAPRKVTSEQPDRISRAEALAPEPIDREQIIRQLRDATVYVLVRLDGATVASGSGFVIDVLGDSAIIVTHQRVAAPNFAELPRSIAKEGSRPKLGVVFRSGMVPELEQTVPAEILAVDQTQASANGLAFLLATGVKNPPVALNIVPKVEATEGTTYIGAGFPQGKQLNVISESTGNPRVTITTGIVGRIRIDEDDQITMLQLGGSILPGDTGGPVIEERSGKLLGVAVASRIVTSIDSVGFIVPTDELRAAFAGRVGAIHLEVKAISPQSADLEVEAQLIDPRRQIKEFS